MPPGGSSRHHLIGKAEAAEAAERGTRVGRGWGDAGQKASRQTATESMRPTDSNKGLFDQMCCGTRFEVCDPLGHTCTVATAPRWHLVSEEEYLAAEAQADAKREYVGGVTYAMAGGSVAHNLIASNVLVSLGAQLRGKPCFAFNSDMKIRIRGRSATRYYYPDVSIVCRSNPRAQAFQDEPTIVVEVQSDATRRTDEDEKRQAYCGIPSLSVYVLLEQDTRAAVVYRRRVDGFDREVYEAPDAIIPLPEVEATLSFAEVYDGVATLEA